MCRPFGRKRYFHSVETDFGMNGILNQLLNALGIESTISWVANPNTAVWTLIVLRVWQFGSPMIIFLAAIKQVPRNAGGGCH